MPTAILLSLEKTCLYKGLDQGFSLRFGHMNGVTDKASRECALQPGPTKQRPDHGHWYTCNRRSRVDLHKVVDGRSYVKYHNPACREADRHPLNERRAGQGRTQLPHVGVAVLPLRSSSSSSSLTIATSAQCSMSDRTTPSWSMSRASHPAALTIQGSARSCPTNRGSGTGGARARDCTSRFETAQIRIKSDGTVKVLDFGLAAMGVTRAAPSEEFPHAESVRHAGERNPGNHRPQGFRTGSRDGVEYNPLQIGAWSSTTEDGGSHVGNNLRAASPRAMISLRCGFLAAFLASA
jgi:hypothetical protein